MRKSKNYWSEDKVLEKINEHIISINHFPTSGDLKTDTGLRRAITKFGGFNYFRKKLGYPIIKKESRPSGFWNEDKIINGLSCIIQEIKHFPTHTELTNMNRADLTNIITATGGMNKYRKLLGFNTFRGKNYWKNWLNFKNEIISSFGDMINIGIFPSRNQLRSVLTGIGPTISYFGGIIKVAEKMGCKQQSFIESPDGHLLNSRYELIFDMFLCQNNIPHLVNGIIHPSRKFRYDFKIGEVFVEIWGLSGKSHYDKIKKEKLELYHQLNTQLIQIDAPTFNKKLSEIYDELQKIITPFRFTDIELTIPTKNNIVAYKNTGFWTFDNTLSELKLFIEKNNNKFPSYLDLHNSGNSGLHAAICKHGGIYFFRNLLGMRKKYQLVGVS